MESMVPSHNEPGMPCAFERLGPPGAPQDAELGGAYVQGLYGMSVEAPSSLFNVHLHWASPAAAKAAALALRALSSPPREARAVAEAALALCSDCGDAWSARALRCAEDLQEALLAFQHTQLTTPCTGRLHRLEGGGIYCCEQQGLSCLSNDLDDGIMISFTNFDDAPLDMYEVPGSLDATSEHAPIWVGITPKLRVVEYNHGLMEIFVHTEKAFGQDDAVFFVTDTIFCVAGRQTKSSLFYELGKPKPIQRLPRTALDGFSRPHGCFFWHDSTHLALRVMHTREKRVFRNELGTQEAMGGGKRRRTTSGIPLEVFAV